MYQGEDLEEGTHEALSLTFIRRSGKEGGIGGLGSQVKQLAGRRHKL
jgi:hypothetical protein